MAKEENLPNPLGRSEKEGTLKMVSPLNSLADMQGNWDATVFLQSDG